MKYLVKINELTLGGAMVWAEEYRVSRSAHKVY